MTTDAAGGMVSSRDFVYLYKIGEEGSSWVMGGKSTEYSEAPARSGIVRAVNGPGLMMVTPGQVSASDGCMVVSLIVTCHIVLSGSRLVPGHMVDGLRVQRNDDAEDP